MIAIYKVSSFYILFHALLSLAMAETSADLNSYCFEKNVNLQDVHQSLKVLLLPRDIVELRPDDGCLDIFTSLDRGKLFEKYLTKRYDLKNEITNASKKEVGCSLDLRITKKIKVDTNTFKLGERNVLSSTNSTSQSVNSMELLVGVGMESEIGVGEEKLKVKCDLIENDKANLTFSYSETDKANIKTQVIIHKNEWINLASVLKDLNGQVKIIGLSQTEISQSAGINETIYELQFK
ncbi:MAG: hypothetical protein Q7U04_13975 [Bacteriovorax sp.]|nr:hypothetical protein [Bacteriovorax sp.]